LLRLIGLGARGRLVVVGIQQVKAAAMRGKLVLAVVAPDASHHSHDKLLPLLDARRVQHYEGPLAAELGAAVGRPSTAAVGITDRALARGIREILNSVGPEGAQAGGQ